MDQPVNYGSALTLRRLRQNQHVRDLTREIWLSYKQFIQPLFVVENLTERKEVPGLSGTYRDSTETILKQIESDLKSGTSKFLLFGIPAAKAECNFNHDFTSGQIAAIKKQFGDDIWLSVDVCLCSSTTHGHCGVLNDNADHLDNALSVHELAKQALAYAEAGADCVAPSDMMDGRIGAMRKILADNNLGHTNLMSYAAKFKSNFYGPFRIAADSSPQKENKLKDRASYQIEASRARDALLSSLRDDAEGADILMVKPGLPYLDILSNLSAQIAKPWAVYQVSGEYAAIELLAQQGLTDRVAAHLELWTAYKRAGADMIISYGARYARDWIEQAG